MMLFLFLLSWLLSSSVSIRFNLYNTDQTRDNNYLYVNCLHYYNRYNLLMTEKTEYCLGPIDNNYSWDDDFLNIYSRNFTFNELRQLNVTTNKLLSWSATIDLAEQYQNFIDHSYLSSASKEIFLNCTQPWFGPRCQFSFDTLKGDSFSSFVQTTVKTKFAYGSSHRVTNLTCYTHLDCNRGGSGMCLDWREVCDGRIDCIDGGADEAQCFDLEVNNCSENEYRCHNGQCIPNEFLDDFGIECLDTSDKAFIAFFRAMGWSFYVFNYEEHSCRSGDKQFTCGDGQCVADFDACENKRHLLLIESISAQGNLAYTCWMSMICLTKILDQVNGTLCNQFLESSDINTDVQTCEDLIQFPTVPVLFGHVRFLYRLKNASDLNFNLSLTPDYICYDRQLCDFLVPTYRHGTYSCRQSQEFNFTWSMKPENWSSLISSVERYFHKCFTRYNNSNIDDSHYPYVYWCKNSSKYISKHRVIDGVSDCYLNDDEEALELSCLIQDVLRFKCANETKCYSSSFSKEICHVSYMRTFDQIEFRQICDRHVEMFPLIINEQNHTDETDCQDWPCNNFYTRCDGFWSCDDGADEENCTQHICPSHFLPCVTPFNYTFTCLPANHVGDGHPDCLGAIDELQHCRNIHYFDLSYFGFRCRDDDKCMGERDLCDSYDDCPLKDDEAFCGDHRSICIQRETVNLTIIENAICFSQKNLKRIKFSLETSPIYPPSNNRTIERITQRSIQPHSISNPIANEFKDSVWLWHCNHGLYVRHWLGGNNFGYKCFCPPNYYGDKCQYQNQRVSFTAQMIAMNRTTVYAMIITLIDDNDDRQKILSYNQYTSVASTGEGCKQKFNAYLTYATRPKNTLTNYSVRVDVFNKTSLTYLASWHFAVPFSFLPVNRMAVVLYAPAQEVKSPSNCPLTCLNGKCMKYMEKEKFFCRCDEGWSGVQCNISDHCNDCSNESICIGMIHNRSICVCPLHKGGPRCLITLSCPENTCVNNGTCLALDDNMHDFSFVCICSNEFHGLFCQITNNKLEISFNNIKVASFILIYVFFINEELLTDGTHRRIIMQKLTMFQRTVSLYIGDTVRIAFVKIDDNYYLAVLQHVNNENIVTSIDSSRQCTSITELFNAELIDSPEIRRVKHYHAICQTHLHVMCFVDKSHMCLCTVEHHANCIRFENTPPNCREDSYCQNGGNCLQDDALCPLTIVCNCTDCFFGDRCQFYAKSIGLTLDDILRYEIRSNAVIHDQTSTIKWTAGLTMIMFTAGLINSILSILTFRTEESQKVGCGIYLLASSITSFLTMTIFTIKFWFLLLTQINPSVSRSVLRGGCISFEFMLKTSLYMDNWLNACVALERLMTVYKGVSFSKTLSKRVARWIIIILPLVIMVSIIHEPLHRNLFDDKDEQRFWCVFHYSPSVHIYNTIILLFHFIGPLCANLFSALFIIFSGARRRALTQGRITYTQHLHEQLKQHKSLIISPIILVILSLPRLIISLISECVKISHNAWLYLFAYFISFIPSITIFFIFVLPSKFYRKQFKAGIKF